jgi:hypothetical protein
VILGLDHLQILGRQQVVLQKSAYHRADAAVKLI